MRPWIIKGLASRLKLSGPFMGPVLTLVGGIAMAQVIVFASRPFLTRLFTPDEFGVLTLFVTIVALIASLISGHYDDAGLLPESPKDGVGLFVLALGLAGVGSLMLALTLPWRGDVSIALKTPELSGTLVLLPIAAVMATWGKSLEGWHSRNDRFGLVATSRVIQSTVVVGIQLVAGFFGAAALGLTGGVAAGFCALVIVVGVPFFVHDRGVLMSAMSWQHLRALANRYRRFAVFSTPAAVLNLAASRIAVFLLATFFGPTTVGFFGLAFGTLLLPVGSVAGAIGQVFGVRAPGAHLRSELGALTELVFSRLVAVSMLPMAMVALAGPELFGFVFGSPWHEAGVYARILSPWLFAMAIASPLTRLFDVTENQKSDLVFSVMLLGAQVGAILIVASSDRPRVAVAAVSVAGLLSRWAQIAWMIRLGGASVRKVVGILVVHLVLAVCLLLPAGLLLATEFSLAWVIPALLGAIAVYAPAVIRLDWKSEKPSARRPTESSET